MNITQDIYYRLPKKSINHACLLEPEPEWRLRQDPAGERNTTYDAWLIECRVDITILQYVAVRGLPADPNFS